MEAAPVSAEAEEEPMQLIVEKDLKKSSCRNSPFSLLHKQHIAKLFPVALLISTALVFFFFMFRQYIGIVRPNSTNNGFLQERHRSLPLNKSESLESPLTFLSARKFSANRKLLVDTERMGDTCTPADITILQGEMGPLPDGIPSFMVQIVNLCVSGCPISDIHVSCGWFASTKLIDPKLFKRVKFNDCVVNNKLPLKGGDSIVFEYANSFQYPLEIASANACCW